MAYYGKRRYNPAAHERREREEKDQVRFSKARARLTRLLGAFRKVPVSYEEGQRAWASPQLRSYTTSRTSQGDSVISTIRKDGDTLYLQEAGGMGWNFYRLAPKRRKAKRKRKFLGKIVLRKLGISSATLAEEKDAQAARDLANYNRYGAGARR